MNRGVKYSYSPPTLYPAAAATHCGSALCHARVSTGFRAPPGAPLFGTDYMPG